MDVILTTANAVAEVKQVTSTVPIVFAVANDPIEQGIVASLARPGGNATGLSNQAVDLAGKRLGLLYELIPTLRRFGVIANAGYSPTALEIGRIQAAARSIGLKPPCSRFRRAEDIQMTLADLNERTKALYVIGDLLTTANRVEISSLALARGTSDDVHVSRICGRRRTDVLRPDFPDLF